MFRQRVMRPMVYPLPAAGTAPTLGVHGKEVQLDAVGTSPASVTLATNTGSAIIFLIGGAHADNSAPSDSLGNTYTQRGTDQGYAGGLWPGFGLEIWADDSITGSASHQISVTKSHTDWEITLVMIEVIGGSSIQVTQGNAAGAGAGVPYSSPSITTSGPARIFAFVSGDGDAATSDQTITPSAGWDWVEYDFQAETAYVPIACATRAYESAGTYSLNWTPAVNQGAAMFMVAVQ